MALGGRWAPEVDLPPNCSHLDIYEWPVHEQGFNPATMVGLTTQIEGQIYRVVATRFDPAETPLPVGYKVLLALQVVQ